MLLAPFHGERMRSYEPLIEEEALAAFALWPEGERFATIRTFNTITLRVILRAVFGAEGAELAALQKLLPPLTAVGQRIVTAPFLRRDLGPGSPGRRFRQMMVRYRELVDALIEGHLADPGLEERIDILALVLRAQRDAGQSLDRSELGDELLTLLVAGHETTASALAWSVERLSRHPEVLSRLEQEAAGEGSALRLATIEEVLRARPVINATGRVAMQPFEVGQWRLPAGTVLLTGIAPLHRDGRFHADALRFDPDRYLGRKPDTYSWIPFGGGMRRCLGAAFAQFEMDVVLRSMLRGFEILPSTEPPERESFRGVAFAPSKGGMARVRRRRVPLGPPAGQAAARAGTARRPAPVVQLS